MVWKVEDRSWKMAKLALVLLISTLGRSAKLAFTAKTKGATQLFSLWQAARRLR
jgi:hypothetical protein